MNEKAAQEGRWRRGLVLAAFALVAFALVARAVEIQVLDRDFLQTQGQARHLRVMEVPAHRGMIQDRRGEPVAVSTPVDSIWGHPEELLESDKAVDKLADALDRAVDELHEYLEERSEREFVYLKRHLAPEEAEAVLALDLPGVYSQREYRRYYPAGEVASQLLGFTNIDDEGQEGLELAYEGWLQGHSGSKEVLRDRLGRIIDDVESLESPRPGEDLQTSIDLRLQYVAYRELKAAVNEHGADAGSMVLLDPETGEVLAMVNQPAFNPNNRRGSTTREVRNRATVDLLEPGSAIKPFIAAAAMEQEPDVVGETFDTSPGERRFADHSVRDIRDYGELDLTGILAKSSNIGITKLAMELEPRDTWQTLEDLGFGSLTASGFPGEAPGHMPHWQDWREIGQVTNAYGYGLSMTPLQLAKAYAAIANGGEMAEASLLRRESEPYTRQALSPGVADELRSMLEEVVGPGGTGARAAVPGYRVAGKTGTVVKSGANGYSEDDYLSVFAGMLPASDPRLVGVVVIDNPRGEDYYGGAVAAPVFSRVMDDAMRLLDVPRDHIDPDSGAIVVRRGGES